MLIMYLYLSLSFPLCVCMAYILMLVCSFTDLYQLIVLRVRAGVYCVLCMCMRIAVMHTW